MCNRFIFTDIDGVLNPKYTKKWKPSCVDIYNKICKDFKLSPVITSTWRIRYDIIQLQKIFINQRILVKIYDYTPNLLTFRGLEIETWLKENDYDKYVIIDDKVTDIDPYVSNIIKCKGWIGLTEGHYSEIKKTLNL